MKAQMAESCLLPQGNKNGQYAYVTPLQVFPKPPLERKSKKEKARLGLRELNSTFIIRSYDSVYKGYVRLSINISGTEFSSQEKAMQNE